LLSPEVGLRWTVGDVASRGFAALRLSIWGARQIFGPRAKMVVCVNSLDIDVARDRTGRLPDGVAWRAAGGIPPLLRPALDRDMAEGVAWKLAPVRLFPDLYEISLDNDCILWALPPAMRRWLEDPDPPCLIAADVETAFGAFSDLTRPEPRNTGIRGLPPGYDLEAALSTVLNAHMRPLESELDEQGLQVVAMERHRPLRIVPTEDVTVCSPIWPHQSWLGACGAHFIGLNTKDLGYDYYGRPASEVVAEAWDRYELEIERRVGVAAYA